MLAFARYYAGLPKRCRPRTLEIVFSSAHDGSSATDGADSAPRRPYDKGRIAFAFTIEHLGTREILPTGAAPPRG